MSSSKKKPPHPCTLDFPPTSSSGVAFRVEQKQFVHRDPLPADFPYRVVRDTTTGCATIPYLEFRASSSPPPSDVGTPGDIWIDVSACVLFARSSTTWTPWRGPHKAKKDMHPHPLVPGRYLWITRKAVLWYTADGIRKNASMQERGEEGDYGRARLTTEGPQPHGGFGREIEGPRKPLRGVREALERVFKAEEEDALASPAARRRKRELEREGEPSQPPSSRRRTAEPEPEPELVIKEVEPSPLPLSAIPLPNTNALPRVHAALQFASSPVSSQSAHLAPSSSLSQSVQSVPSPISLQSAQLAPSPASTQSVLTPSLHYAPSPVSSQSALAPATAPLSHFTSSPASSHPALAPSSHLLPSPASSQSALTPATAPSSHFTSSPASSQPAPTPSLHYVPSPTSSQPAHLAPSPSSSQTMLTPSSHYASSPASSQSALAPAPASAGYLHASVPPPFARHGHGQTASYDSSSLCRALDDTTSPQTNVQRLAPPRTHQQQQQPLANSNNNNSTHNGNNGYNHSAAIWQPTPTPNSYPSPPQQSPLQISNTNNMLAALSRLTAENTRLSEENARLWTENARLRNEQGQETGQGLGVVLPPATLAAIGRSLGEGVQRALSAQLQGESRLVQTQHQQQLGQTVPGYTFAPPPPPSTVQTQTQTQTQTPGPSPRARLPDV